MEPGNFEAVRIKDGRQCIAKRYVRFHAVEQYEEIHELSRASVFNFPVERF